MSVPLARIALALSIICAAAALAAGPGYRFNVWSLTLGFQLLQWSAYGAIAAAIAALAAAIAARRSAARRGFAQSLVALVVAIATVAGPAWMIVRAKQAPPIHDITTDTDDPPRFVAVLAARAGAPNAADYAGPDMASQQRRAYPQIAPLQLDAASDAAFRRALTAAREMGWTIVAVVPAEGRIEATDTTTFFGFKDDIVVRVRPVAAGSRVDVRSVSRLGEGDIGTNARRIEAYLARVRAAG